MGVRFRLSNRLEIWTRPQPQLSSPRLPKFSVVLAPKVNVPRSELNSWMIPAAQSSETEKDQSVKETFLLCWNPKEKPEDSDNSAASDWLLLIGCTNKTFFCIQSVNKVKKEKSSCLSKK